MAVTREDVLHVAKLARLELSEAEVGRMQNDLSQIIDYIDQLSELDTRQIPPTPHVAVERAPLRADEVRPGLPHHEALSQAPRSTDVGFAVPTFVDES